MPYIISPYREIEMGSKARVSGHVKIKKVDRVGRTTFESEFENIITDEFLRNGLWGMSDYAKDLPAYSIEMAVGTGVQTTPASTDTALGNFLAETRCSANSTGGKINVFNYAGPYSATNPPVVLGSTVQDDYRPVLFNATFDYSEAVGQLTELGLRIRRRGTTEGQEDLLTRALIRDNSGNPVQLNKTTAEKLIIEYELRLYRPSEPIFDTTLNGQDLRFFIPTIARGVHRGSMADLNRDLLDMTDPQNLVNRGAPIQDGKSYLDFLTDEVSSYRAGNFSYMSYPATAGLLLHKDPTKTALANYFNRWDIEDNLFTFSRRIEPDTVDRSGVAIKGYNTSNFFDGSNTNPHNCSLVPTFELNNGSNADGFMLAGNVAILDPVTNAPKTFTLPAGYRLDIQYSFERTR